MNDKRKRLWAVCLSAAVCCAVFMAAFFLSPDRAEDNREGTAFPEPCEEAGEDLSPIDFEALREKNADVYAYVSVPGAGISEPVLQHESDGSYYLLHTIDRSAGYPGAVYTEAEFTGKDFTDTNTVIYGHNMPSNGQMFTKLHLFEEPDFFENNKEVVIYLPDRELHYLIYAAVQVDDRHVLDFYDLDKKEGYEDFLQWVTESPGHIRKELTLKLDERPFQKLLTLSTCIRGDDTKRYLVVAVLQE